MPEGCYIPLSDRGVVTVKGKDALSFLQGLVSADVETCRNGVAVWAALLTPQGKYLFDFFISKVNEGFLLECESDRLMDLGRLLHKYKMRADVELGIAEGVSIYALLGDTAFEIPEGCTSYVDPRLAVMGRRVILIKDTLGLIEGSDIALADIEEYHRLRIDNGLPDGSKDMTPEKALLLENGFDELSGIGWDKGCYVGQELTARTKYRGLVKKRLLPVSFDGAAPENGAEITLGDKNAGEMKSSVGNIGLALIRIERLEQASKNNSSLHAGEVMLSANVPPWVKGVNV